VRRRKRDSQHLKSQTKKKKGIKKFFLLFFKLEFSFFLLEDKDKSLILGKFHSLGMWLSRSFQKWRGNVIPSGRNLVIFFAVLRIDCCDSLSAWAVLRAALLSLFVFQTGTNVSGKVQSLVFGLASRRARRTLSRSDAVGTEPLGLWQGFQRRLKAFQVESPHAERTVNHFVVFAGGEADDAVGGITLATKPLFSVSTAACVSCELATRTKHKSFGIGIPRTNFAVFRRVTEIAEPPTQSNSSALGQNARDMSP
jgi:hypothetical protein